MSFPVDVGSENAIGNRQAGASPDNFRLCVGARPKYIPDVPSTHSEVGAAEVFTPSPVVSRPPFC
jgi:hypothetical protein